MLKINFLGDSITKGYAVSSIEKCYVSLVGQMLNAEVRNYGISGTRIAKNKCPSINPSYDQYFASRVEMMKRDADLVFVFGGVNDFGHGDAPLGVFGDKAPDTFYGALDDLINKLEKYFAQEKITFILPLYYENENDPHGFGECENIKKPLSDYRKAICEVAAKYNIKILDIKDEVGPASNKMFFADGLHPNDAGNKIIAELIVEYIKKITK